MSASKESGSSREMILKELERIGGSNSSAATRFAEAFLANTVPEDLEDANPAALAATISSLWTFACGRRRGHALVRAYNPEQHPWKAGGTIVEIVNDDMPFLVNSVTAELNRRNLAVHLAIHPIIGVETGSDGPDTVEAGNDVAGQSDSIIHLRVTGQPDPDALLQTVAGLKQVVEQVREVVQDWRAIMRKLTHTAVELTARGEGLSDLDIAEAVEFLQWLGNNNFTFLGYREYLFSSSGDSIGAEPVAKSGLGLLRDSSFSLFEGFDSAALPSHAFSDPDKTQLILVSKADRRSTVHRDVQMDTILVRWMGQDGRVIGLHLFVGLFTSVVYRQPISSIPMLRRGVRRLLVDSGFAADSYDGRALAHVLETLPRDELFQMESRELHTIALKLMRLQRRRGAAMFTRHDPFGRYVSCLVYLPREHFDDALRERVEHVLSRGFGGPVTDGKVQISEDLLARLHFLVRIGPSGTPSRSVEDISAEVVAVCRSWIAELAIGLTAAHGEATGAALFARYRRAFSASWRDRFDATATVADIAHIEDVLQSGRTAVQLEEARIGEDEGVRFKIIVPSSALPLSDVIPILENMGFRIINEIPHEIVTRDGGVVWIHDFGMVGRQDVGVINVQNIGPEFETAFLRILGGDVEDDGFNALILTGGLNWRQVVILRALCSYLHQAGVPFDTIDMAAILTRNGVVARELVRLFEGLFTPSEAATALPDIEKVHERIGEALENVDNPDEDRLLRRLLNLIEATLRTNYFVSGDEGESRPYLSLKFDSTAITDLPLPRPAREIFVYSPRVEGIHCRGGLVARGGLRWSDRRSDYRTEILGLMKAQMTKNAVIVPEGSKGGFVVKKPPGDGSREALIAEGIDCYKTYIRGLLDLTDNLRSGEVIPPAEVVRRDDDDPYLVVAADKGTATFSDIANGLSAEYGFWLGDAFASGGSAGYDHKKMGITARGAWECVKRHFREIGTDIQTEDFTVVGIGDMSGDVFGNGMLLSRHIRLTGAFNHIHIFIDPDPKSEVSWHERQRLFRLPRSSWEDYNPDLISEGGGVYSRTAKEIPLSAEARRLFDLPEEGRLTPGEVIRAMLRAKVDLLWFGGIGTYVKSLRESHESVGDRANDDVRVDARELRCKVVGEGANLGVTQLARVVYAQRGGRINADFIDNSAGVASSDQEVNIKILMGGVMSNGGISLEQRNRLLEDMTDDVAEHCLMDNYRQGLALTLAQARAPEAIAEHQRFIRRLELSGDLDRVVECLPGDEELAERAARGQGLTRPELAVLLAYAKNTFYKQLLSSDVPDDPWLMDRIGYYFPPQLRERYLDLMPKHRLQREITATYVANSLINRAGPIFVETIASEKGATPARIARAYLVCREVFGLPAIWQGIEDLDNRIAADVQTSLHLEVLNHISRATVWFATKSGDDLDMAATIEGYGPGMTALEKGLDQVTPEALLRKAADAATRYAVRDVPRELAERVTRLELLFAGCDIVRLSAQTNMQITEVAEAYFTIGEWFGLDLLHETAGGIVPENQWQAAALAASVDELYDSQAALTRNLIGSAGNASAVKFILGKWEQERHWQVDGLREIVTEIGRADHPDPSMLPVAANRVRALCSG